MSSSIRFAPGARPIALVVAVLALALAAPAFAQVYKWKDDKGVTHYSDAPPPKGATTKGEVKQVAVPPAPPTPAAVVKPASPATTVARAPAPPVVDPAVERAAAQQRAANCKRAQENLVTLQQTYAAVGVDKDGDGKNDSVLTAEERTAQTASMQDAVKANCAAAP